MINTGSDRTPILLFSVSKILCLEGRTIRISFRPSLILVLILLVLSSNCNSYAQPPVLEKSWSLSTGNGMPLAILPDRKDNRFIYVALKSGGLAVLKRENNASAPQLVASVPRHLLKNLDVCALSSRGNLLYLALGDFFRATGQKAALAVLDISEPQKPQLKSIWQSEEKVRGASCIEISGSQLYLGAMSHGIYIFNLEPDRTKPTLLTVFKPDPNFPRQRPGRFAQPNVRDIKVSGNLMYTAYDAGGLRIIDLTDKSKPVERSKYINQKMIGRPQAYNGIALDYPFAYISLDYGGLEVLNIANPELIRQVAWLNPWRAGTRQNNWFNSPGHTNQIAYHSQSKRLFVSAGAAQLLIIDVNRPESPLLEQTLGRKQDKLGAWSVALEASQPSMLYLGYIKAVLPFRGGWNGLQAYRINGESFNAFGSSP